MQQSPGLPGARPTAALGEKPEPLIQGLPANKEGAIESEP